MTYCASVKEEISRIKPKDKRARLSELAALLHTAGFLQLGQGGMKLRVRVDSHAAAVKAERLCAAYPLQIQLQALEVKKFRRTQSFDVFLFGDGLSALLEDTGFLASTPSGAQLKSGPIGRLTDTDACARAFLRGAFLGSGYVSDPDKSYHLEIVAQNETLAEGMRDICAGFEIFVKQIYRKGTYVIYLKESESIADFFGLIGASKAVLDFQNIRILKEIRNNTNRAVNCDSANLNKAVETALRQMRAIELLENEVGLDNLPPALCETAKLRKRYPESTLQELVALQNGAIGKSGLYHRFSKIEELAKEIETERGSK